MDIFKKSLCSSLFNKVFENKIKCLACNHNCIISIGKTGICRVRKNDSLNLFVPWGYVSSLNIDPIEKKPLYHFMPGSKTLSFGMLGCNFKCLYCQNYEISQNIDDNFIIEITEEEIIEQAIKNGIKIIVSTYNEPTVTVEWARSIFETAKKKNNNIKTGFVSNGYISDEGLSYIKDYIDFIKVDLKSFDENKFSKVCGANLRFVLRTIENIYKNSIHLELVTLIVPGFNDDIKEIEKMVDFIKSISCEIPWHITRFHPDYKMLNKNPTDIKKIDYFIEFAKKHGLKYVYGGNYNTCYNSTICPKCDFKIIERKYMGVTKKDFIVKEKNGFCPNCGYRIYGVFS